MTRPRREQISLSDTPFYHIVTRCVRRGFLCGTDPSSGNSYEHRRIWIENRLRLLSSLFAVDICAYAVLSNHFHLVVKLEPTQIDALTPKEIASRWTCLFKGPLLIQKWLGNSNLTPIELDTVLDTLESYRERLKDLGWFMKCLNEPIARQANKEDECTGHFWESRYKSQALLNEEALLSCMAYVDLNPVRAGIAQTPETSPHTSIKERVSPNFQLAKAIKEQVSLAALLKFDAPLKPLANFEGSISMCEQKGILFNFEEYLELVDYSGRCLRKNKTGAIPAHIPPILQRLNIDNQTWRNNVANFEKVYWAKFSRRQSIRNIA